MNLCVKGITFFFAIEKIIIRDTVNIVTIGKSELVNIHFSGIKQYGKTEKNQNR